MAVDGTASTFSWVAYWLCYQILADHMDSMKRPLEFIALVRSNLSCMPLVSSEAALWAAIA